jgi:predicted dienelactone hydrolase
MKLVFVGFVLSFLSTTQVCAQPVSEAHRLTSEKTASLRDAQHREGLRITVWYPAAADAVEHSLTVGPPDKPLFNVGSVASDAAFAADPARWPVIVLSHGYGGTARIMGWFGIAMARDGYIVVAVDHPGNNGLDQMTVAGAILYWDRSEDLRAALEATEQDPAIGPHIDRDRVGVAGFSAGGFTALVAAGARVDPRRLGQFCAANPDDGICRPQKEFAITPEAIATALTQSDVAAEEAHAGDDHAISAVRAAFAMAPALVQALDPAGLAQMRTPVAIVLGDADTVAPPATNGLVAAKLIPGVELSQLPGVGHYDFLSSCTEGGKAVVPQCDMIHVPQAETHNRAIAAARDFFGRKLKRRP